MNRNRERRRTPSPLQEEASPAAAEMDGALQGVDQEEIDTLLSMDGSKADAASREVDREKMATLMEDAYGDGVRLGRIGDSTLMVSEDGLTAFFRGPLPEGTTYEEVAQCLEETGVRSGIMPGRIHDILPQKKARRKDRPRRKATGRGDVVIAQGQPSVPPGETRIEYRFEQVPEEDVQVFKSILEGPALASIKKCRIPLQFVRPGQVLARVVQEPGKSGRDVFGEAILPEAPGGASLRSGENVVLSEDGLSLKAEICGYAGLLDERVVVLAPLWISRDLMQVFFAFLPRASGCTPPTVADLKVVLHSTAIVHGIDEEALERLCVDLEKGREVDCCTRIARGTEAVAGDPVAWAFAFEPELTRYFGEIERILTRSERVDYLINYSQGLAGKALGAGEQLAIKKPGTEARMGRDVFGEEFLADEVPEVHLKTGDHVRLEADGKSCTAEIYGYVGLEAAHVCLISPIWVAPDGEEAYFLNLSQLGEKRVPAPAEIDHLLKLSSVCCGIDRKAIEVLCTRMEMGIPTDLAVLLARVQEPRPGADGRFEFSVDVEQQPGLFRDDGTVDFKQLNLAPLLEAGQLIGDRMPATKGADGADVRGRKLPARDGRDLEVDIGKHVRLLRRQGVPDCFIAEVQGELVWVDRREQDPPALHLAVHRTRVVQGDVDYETGNIDFPGSVHVEGAIRSGFEVRAEGNVVVGDAVEDRACIEAGGNVAIKRGIAGEHTRVVAGGSVYARFVSAARVRAGADLMVSEYIYHASIEAGGSVSVMGSSRRPKQGAIAGGYVVAARHIRAQHIGTGSGGPTSVTAGVDPLLLQQTTELQKLIDRYRMVINKILRALEVESLDRERIRGILANLLLKARGARKKAIAAAVKNLLELQKRCDRAVDKKKVLERKARELSLGAAIAVSGSIAANTRLRIGACSRVIGEEATSISNIRFSLSHQKEKLQLQMTSD